MVLLGLASTVSYLNALDTAFVLDDVPHIVKEQQIRPPFTVDRMLSTDRPVVRASLMLNYAIGELSVRGYHIFNLVAHILCTFAFFGLARLTLLLPVFSGRYEGRADWLALAAAGIFALHPIQTESVTYTIQRAESLVAICLLASLWIAAQAARGMRASRWVPALLVVSAVGVLSKQSFVIAPVLFGLYDFCFIARGRVADMRRRWPVYVLLFAVSLAGGIRGRAYNPGDMAGFSIPDLPYWQYPLWQFGVLVYYLRLVLIPDRLCFDCGYYGPWPVFDSHLGDMVILPAVVLVAIGVASWWVRRKAPLVTFCVWGAAIILAPTSSVFPLADVYVEHRLYLPIALLALLFVVSVFDAGEAAGRRGWLPPKAIRIAEAVAALLLCVALGALTVARNDVYASRLELYKDAVTKAPKSRRVQYNLANAYRHEGQLEKAVPHYLETIKLNPQASRGYVNLGITYLALERYDEAAEVLETARQLQPDLGLIERNLARAHLLGRNAEGAVEAARRAVNLQPRAAEGHRLLAQASEQAGRTDEALAAYRTALRLNPRDRHSAQRIEALSGAAP